MSFKDLSHNDLIKHLANNPSDELAWLEFISRFQKRICFTIYRTAQTLDFKYALDNVNDLAQEVYAKLLKNDAEPLKNFTGKYENSILNYLDVIATRIVYIEFEASKAQKRPPAHLGRSINAPIAKDGESGGAELHEILKVSGWDAEERTEDLKEAIEHCLSDLLSSSRNYERDRIIFCSYFYDGLSPDEIASDPNINISSKRIINRIGEQKKLLIDCLKSKFDY